MALEGSEAGEKGPSFKSWVPVLRHMQLHERQAHRSFRSFRSLQTVYNRLLNAPSDSGLELVAVLSPALMLGSHAPWLLLSLMPSLIIRLQMETAT